MRKFNSVFAVLVFAVFALFLAVEGADAFCVYNNTDTRIHAKQTSGQRSSHGLNEMIAPGDKECCNWQNKDCNEKGKRNNLVAFDVGYTGGSSGLRAYYVDICHDFAIQAGGWMTVEGKDGSYKCVRHDY